MGVSRHSNVIPRMGSPTTTMMTTDDDDDDDKSANENRQSLYQRTHRPQPNVPHDRSPYTSNHRIVSKTDTMASKEYHSKLCATWLVLCGVFCHPVYSLIFFCWDSFFYQDGLDMKSLALNLASTLLFILPIVAYLYTEHLVEAISVVGGSILLSLLVPPIGWRRPHPYSDDPTNLPYPKKSN